MPGGFTRGLRNATRSPESALLDARDFQGAPCPSAAVRPGKRRAGSPKAIRSVLVVHGHTSEQSKRENFSSVIPTVRHRPHSEIPSNAISFLGPEPRLCCTIRNLTGMSWGDRESNILAERAGNAGVDGVSPGGSGYLCGAVGGARAAEDPAVSFPQGHQLRCCWSGGARQAMPRSDEGVRRFSRGHLCPADAGRGGRISGCIPARRLRAMISTRCW